MLVGRLSVRVCFSMWVVLAVSVLFVGLLGLLVCLSVGPAVEFSVLVCLENYSCLSVGPAAGLDYLSGFVCLSVGKTKTQCPSVSSFICVWVRLELSMYGF